MSLKRWLVPLTLVVALSALLLPAAASAAGEPDISLVKETPEQVLLGAEAPVTLRAHNPKGQPRGYNLTFRDVLPVGVEYVPGSASPAIEPQVLKDAPNDGETTLIFQNVADLSENSQYALSFRVKPTPAVYTIGQTYTDKAGAYVNKEPRFEPKFDAEGLPIEEPDSYTGSGEDEKTTTLTAVEIEKLEPSPEHELLRGVHEHQTVYTLKLRNNKVGPTKDLVVDDYLPAGLEFLGCGSADNTTKTKTNEGGTNPEWEYPESGPIFPGNNPAAPNCREPDLVETEEVDPPGPQPKAVYTHVRWEDLGELPPGGETEFQYRAAVPILQNTLTWPNGKPSGALTQAANLDNNTGPETFDEQQLTNVSRVGGKYEGTAEVEDTGELTVVAEDLAIQKGVTPTTIGDQQISHWTFHIESSEYRSVKDVEIDDQLPNGLCPLGKENYEGPFGAPVEVKTECNEVSGELPNAEYTKVEEQEDGSFLIHWDKTTVPELALMPPSETLEITFPTRTRTNYQSEFKDAEPVLTGDSWSNHVDIKGPDYARCTPTAQKTCEGGGTPIFHEEPDGELDLDESSAEQKAGGVEIDKTVRQNGGPVPVDCSGTYVDGVENPFPLYGPGDRICWQLEVKFADDLFSGDPLVTDFLPPGQTYVPGSAQEVLPTNTVNAALDPSEASAGVLKWTMNGGKDVEADKVFLWRFQTEMQTSISSFPGDITGNLMKFSYSNTEGETFPKRDRAEVERTEPDLRIIKGVYAVGGNTVGGEGAPNNDKDATGAHGGEFVKYGIQLENTGTLNAEAIEVWDRLPAGIECSDLKSGSISDGGVCETGNIIVWKGLTVAEKATRAALTYETQLPSDVAPNQTYENTAGVRQFQSLTNTGTPFSYYPEGNIDPKFGEEHPANTGQIKDPAKVTTVDAALVKSRETTVEQSGNDLPEQATIGEVVKYKVTATIPAGTKLFGSPALTDPLGTRLVLMPGTVKGNVDGTEIPPAGEFEGFTIGEESGNPVLEFPETYEVPASGSDVPIVLEFEAKVADIATNTRVAASLPNEAKLTYKDQAGTTQSKSATATTTLVEPNVKVKKSHVGGKIVKPGQIVEWTVTAENPSGTRVSAANDSTVVDSVPLGMTPVNGSTPVEDGKTVEPDGGTWNEEKRTITWSIPLLNPGGTKALHYSLKVNEPANAGSIFKNSATLKTTSLPGDVTGERTASSASHTGYEAKAEDEATLNDAELEKSVAAPKGTTIGSPLTYTLKLKLPPNINFFDTTVEDQLPKGVAFDGTASVKCEPGCDPVAEGAITLNPKTVGGAQLLGWFFGDVSSAPSERVVTITYNAHIAQELEAGVKVKDKDKLQNKAIGLYSGADKFTEPPTEPPARAEYTNKTNEPSAQIEVTEPKLTIDKAVTGEVAPPSNTQPGDKYTYTLTVTNSGDSPAYDITVKDNNPQGVLRNVQPKGSVSGELEGEDLLAPGWSTGDPLEWDIPGGIAPGASVKLQYKGELAPSAELSDGDTIINVADIPSYFGAPETQRNEEGPSRFREYTEDPEDTVTLETSLPKPKVEKTVGTGGAEEATAEISKPFVWQVKVTNQATAATWKGVDLLDTLPKGWEYVAGSAEMPVGTTLEDPGGVGSVNGAGEEELSWTDLADLAPGASFTVTFKAVPTLALALLPGQYTNEAKASGEDTAGATASEAGPYEAEDSAKANLITPGLEIKKTPDDGPAVAGQPSAYDIEIHNGGGAVATSVEVSDLLGAGNEYSAGSATATPPTGFSETSVEAVGAGETRVKWAIASIAAGGTVTIHVPVSLSPSIEDNTRLVDHANVKSAEETTPVEDEGSLIVKRKVDVEITKEQSKATPNAGEPETYTLHVKNNGPSDAKGVVVTDPVPTGTELLGVPSGCEESPAGTVKCAIGDLALDATRDFTIETRVLPSATGTIVNKANVTSTTEDTEPDNNEAEVEATVEHLANVVIQKSGPEAPVLLGSTFTYTLEVENKGPSDAENVEVDDALPGEVEALAVDTDTGSCEPPSATVECALGTMVPGAKAVIHVTVKAIGMPSDPEGVVNVGKATSTTPDPETPNESEAKTKVEPAADLAITKTAPATVPADGELTYSLHVENFGPSDGTEVAISDPLPAGTQFVSASEGCTQAGGTVTCVLGELKVGDTHDYQVTVKVPLASADKDLVNTATVKGHEADPETENNSSTVTTKTGPAADLEIRKTMGAAEAGQPLSYTLAVTNHGPSRSSAVTVHDTLPAGVSFKSAQASQGSCSASGSTVTCNLGGLDSGASAQVTITVDVAADASGSLRNKATVEGPEPDPNKQNNESTVEGPIKPAPKKDEGKPNEGKPNLHLVKTADDSSPKVGDPIHYRVTVSNRGTAAAKNVRVTDTMNGPAKVVSIDTDKGSCENKGDGKITCLIPDLAPGQAAHILVTVVAKDAGELRNVASAEAGNGEMAVADNRAVKDVTASGGRGSFALTKTASRKVVPGGKKVSFAIRLRVGREALTDVTVCDRLPKGLVFVKAPGASFDRGRACWQRDFVAAHKVLKLRLVARAVRGYKSMRAKNVASADAGNARRRAAAATVRIKPAFGGKPGGVTG